MSAYFQLNVQEEIDIVLLSDVDTKVSKKTSIY